MTIPKKIKLFKADAWTSTDKQLKDYKIFVFDLDNTLYLHNVRGEYRDVYHKKVKNFLNYLKDYGKLLYIASHNLEPKCLLLELEIPLITFDGIIKETKDVNPHSNTISEYTSKKDMICEILENHKDLSYEDVVFFDDNKYNIKEVESINVKSIYIDESKGINFSDIC
jgi:HAD superfamily phosphatase (TIGR01681 family)